MTQRELEARRGGQEAELQEFEERLFNSTIQSAIQAVLQPVVNEMVARIVHQEVEHRVKEEVCFFIHTSLVPYRGLNQCAICRIKVRNQMSKRHPNIREELALCQRRIAEAKIELHNAYVGRISCHVSRLTILRYHVCAILTLNVSSNPCYISHRCVCTRCQQRGKTL